MKTRYNSFLLRVWTESADEVRIALVDTSNGSTRTFSSLLELVAFVSGDLPKLTSQAEQLAETPTSVPDNY